MQEHVKAKVLAQAMRGRKGKSPVEMIGFLEENVKSTGCLQIGCKRMRSQLRTCKCGELVHRQEYETLQSCENCGGYQSTVTWVCLGCKTHKGIETSTIVAQIQAIAEDMDAGEAAARREFDRTGFWEPEEEDADESEKSSSNTCTHPKEKRSYIGNNLLRCELCGAEFS